VTLPSACAGTPNAKAANAKTAEELNIFLVIEVMTHLPVRTLIYDSFVTA
jgi:hypothetical protein